VKLLLDTHIFLWLQTAPERLGQQLKLVEDHETELLVSAVTSWEIAIKHGIGRLPLPDPPERYVPDRMKAIGATPLAIEHSAALAVSALPPVHRDPFDRLLVAQARLLDVSILTADPVLGQYPVRTVLVGGPKPPT
jgi:PIN domain nuclease of toxin-antitoxin system